MSIQPRAYQDERDLEAMRAILMTGRRAGTTTHYAHIGDLDWCLFDLSLEEDRRQTIYLWEDTEHESRIVGWTLFSPSTLTFAVFVHPKLLASEQAAQIWLRSEEEMASGVCALGEQQMATSWVTEHDTWLNAHLEERGLIRNRESLLHLECSLIDDLPEPFLPTGFYVRHVIGEEIVSIPIVKNFDTNITAQGSMRLLVWWHWRDKLSYNSITLLQLSNDSIPQTYPFPISQIGILCALSSKMSRFGA